METTNIGGTRPQDMAAALCSNFPRMPFVVDDVELASLEGFVQGIKFPVGDERREKAFGLSGRQAKRIGRKAERIFVWWQGMEIPYGSPAHHALIERALRAKFGQLPEAMQALLATEGTELVHDLGHAESSHTSLPSAVFCAILTRIREERLARS